MNRTEYLLVKLMEECSEVSQRASKALRFGLEEIQPGQEFNNADRIMEEVRDLTAVIWMLQDDGYLPPNKMGLINYEGAIREKCEKIERWMVYSQERGRLDRSGPSGGGADEPNHSG